jgi:hypothetical protein
MRVLRTQIYEEILRYLFGMLYESFIKKASGEEPRELKPGKCFDSIIGEVFSDEWREIYDALEEVSNRLVNTTQTYQQRVIDKVAWTIDRLGGLNKYRERGYVEPLSAGLYALESLLELRREILTQLAIRKTLAYSMYTALQLDSRRVCVNPAENFERSIRIRAVEPLEVHRVWSILAEEGVGLVCQLLCEPGMCGQIDTVVRLVEGSCRRMLDEGGDKVILELQTYAVSRDKAARRSRISEVISKFVKSAAEPANPPEEVRSAVIKYYVDHVEAFGNLPKESATAEALRKYIDVALCTRSFLEYEVYSRLVSMSIPAVPRLRVDYGEERSKEIDLLIAIGDYVYVAEVTTERSRDLGKEVESLCDTSQILDADGVLLISTNENCKKVAEPRYCNVKCLSFEELCASPQKVLETLIDKSRN